MDELGNTKIDYIFAEMLFEYMVWLYIGPWATGRVDWSPLAGLTGTRPIVDHYSITRYSGNEWRQRNQDILSKQEGIFNNCYK